MWSERLPGVIWTMPAVAVGIKNGNPPGEATPGVILTTGYPDD